MRLIDEKELEEGAYKYSHSRLNNAYYNFIEGAEFAEQKILPMMVGFAEWIGIDNVAYAYKDGRRVWYNCADGSYHTTEYLLEIYLKTKEK